METKIIVAANYIAALKIFAAQKDTRYYLNGICLEIGAKETRMIATDGHRLGCFRIASEQEHIIEPLTDVIIHNDLIKPIKAKGGPVTITIGDVIEGKDADGYVIKYRRPVSLAQDGVAWSGETIEGKFPQWRRVIPEITSGEVAQFNANYVGDIGKAWSCLHPGNKGRFPASHIAHNGTGGALVSFDSDDFIGVIMPCKTEAFSRAPVWAQDSLKLPEKPMIGPIVQPVREEVAA